MNELTLAVEGESMGALIFTPTAPPPVRLVEMSFLLLPVFENIAFILIDCVLNYKNDLYHKNKLDWQETSFPIFL